MSELNQKVPYGWEYIRKARSINQEFLKRLAKLEQEFEEELGEGFPK